MTRTRVCHTASKTPAYFSYHSLTSTLNTIDFFVDLFYSLRFLKNFSFVFFSSFSISSLPLSSEAVFFFCIFSTDVNNQCDVIFSFHLRYSAAVFCCFEETVTLISVVIGKSKFNTDADEKVISGSNAKPPICQIRISRQQSYFWNLCSGRTANGICQIGWWNRQTQMSEGLVNLEAVETLVG